ncbi:hypothetical protein ASPCAL04955 [Aspergillus calidoustus]|uniref:Uncharacterized protein n=1 Tax=Aspergillus calidoustus TaxID=454130 RepID=A0A0U5GSH4_ASPCI|nr:hypothetical protein ASPCAL04955 [Aspergillus calidoustus]
MFAVMGCQLALLTWDIWVYAETLAPLAIIAWLPVLLVRLDNELHFTNGTESLTTLAVSPINPAHWTYGEGQPSSLPSDLRSKTASPYTPNSGVHISHLLFTGLLQRRLRAGVTGNLAQESDSMGLGGSTSITQWGLFSCAEIWNSSIYGNLTPTAVVKPSQCRKGTPAATIEDHSHNFTYSMLNLNTNTSVPIFASSPKNVYT